MKNILTQSKNFLGMNIYSITFASLLSLSALAQAPDSKDEKNAAGSMSTADEAKSLMNSTSTNKTYSDVDLKQYLFEIEYDVNSSTLTEKAKSILVDSLNKLKSYNKNSHLIVLSWSDEEYPSKNVKKLSKEERKLADNRNDVIKKYLTTNNSIKIDTYNMAEKPSVIAKWFNTSDNKLKNSLLAAGLPTTADSSMFSSHASHSVIFVKVK